MNTDHSSLRIFCVDEDRTMQQAVTLGFEAYGFEVVTASPGIDAIMQFRAENGNFDALLIDHGGPKANGLVFVKQVRALGYQGRVLVMAKRLSASEYRAYQECALSGVFSKPFDVSMVATLLLQPSRRSPDPSFHE